MKRRTDMKERDDAVSPVIGVMLMIVVTLIIAAVVSAMAGGVFTAQSPAPTISAKATCSLDKDPLDKKNPDALDMNCTLYIDILDTSEVIDTKDLKITVDSMSGGGRLFVTIDADRPQDINGTGAGVPSKCLPSSSRSDLQFGDFTLRSGVQMSGKVVLRDTSKSVEYDFSAKEEPPEESYKEAIPKGQDGTWGGMTANQLPDHSKIPKIEGHSLSEHMVLFEDGWEYTRSKEGGTLKGYGIGYLNPGDKVSVKIIYIPNGQTVYSSDVRVVS